MQTKPFSLPEWSLAGGETRRRTFTLYQDENGLVYNIPGASAQIAVVDFVNQHSEAKFTKPAEITMNDDGQYCEVLVELSPTDTVNLHGKYIYQLTIKDANGNVAALKGIMYISENVDKAFIS